MADIQRQSPVRFGLSAVKTEARDNWAVALEYSDEGRGPWLADLCHKTRWDLQDGNIAGQSPCGLAVPASPGQCTLENNILINRMNGTQAAIWHLDAGKAPEMPALAGYTDVTESTLCLALFGPQAFYLAEKLTALDFMDPAKSPPFLLQGPLCHVPCQIVTLQKNSDRSGGLLLTCSRGYGDSMVQAIRDAGAEFGLRPAGESRFQDWLASVGQVTATSLGPVSN